MDIYSDDAMSLVNKGVALYDLGKYDEAIKYYDNALKIAPNDTKALAGKGVALNKLGKHDDAKKCFDNVKMSK